MDDQGRFARLFGSPVLSVIGLTADIAAVAVLLVNENLVRWVADRPQIMILIAAILLLSFVAVLNRCVYLAAQAVRLVGDLDEAKENLDELRRQPSQQDVSRFAGFWEQFGSESVVYNLLKNDYLTDKARYFQLSALDRLVSTWKDDLTNYHDKELAEAFSALKDSMLKLRSSTVTNYWGREEETPVKDSDFYGIPLEWEGGAQSRWDKAIDELNSRWDDGMDSYKKFVNLAHEKKVTEK